MNARQCTEEILGVLEKHGVGTYCIVLQDPDSQAEFCAIQGHKPWIYGELLLKADEIKTAYNAEVTRQALGLENP